MSFSLNFALGPFLVLVLLITELVITPFKNLFKDELLFCGARHVVAGGQEVGVRSTPKICEAIGLYHFVTSKGLLIRFCNALKVGNLLLLFLAMTFWERTIQQQTIPETVSVLTTSEFNEDLLVARGKTYIMSPFPISGLTEQGAKPLSPFSKNGTGSDAQYRVRENIALSSQYASNCIKTPNATHTTVFMAAVIQDHQGNRRSSCLDGSGSSSLSIAATFESVPETSGREVRSIELLRAISTDSISTVYAAHLEDDAGDEYTGYITITSRSYFNANIVWSFYGLLRKGDREVWRLSLPLAGSREERPCYSDEKGIWKLTDELLECPSGTERNRHKDPAAVSVKPLQDSGLFIHTSDAEAIENADLLAWVVETDYARFWASRTFSGELRARVRAERMFFSAYEGQSYSATDGATRTSVSFGKIETVLLGTALVFLFVQAMVGVVWGYFQRRKYNIRSEVVSYKAIAAMYKAEVTGTQIDVGQTTRLQIGICDVEEGVQRLGIVQKGEAMARQSSSFLQHRGSFAVMES